MNLNKIEIILLKEIKIFSYKKSTGITKLIMIIIIAVIITEEGINNNSNNNHHRYHQIDNSNNINGNIYINR